jgi:hypothetical protein
MFNSKHDYRDGRTNHPFLTLWLLSFFYIRIGFQYYFFNTNWLIVSILTYSSQFYVKLTNYLVLIPEQVHWTFETFLLLLNFQSKFCCENFPNYYQYYKLFNAIFLILTTLMFCPQEKLNEKLLFELFMLQMK